MDKCFRAKLVKNLKAAEKALIAPYVVMATGKTPFNAKHARSTM